MDEHIPTDTGGPVVTSELTPQPRGTDYLALVKKYWPWALGALVLIGVLFGGYSYKEKLTKATDEIKTLTTQNSLYQTEIVSLKTAKESLTQQVKTSETSLTNLKRDMAKNTDKEKFDRVTGKLIEKTVTNSESHTSQTEQVNKLQDQLTQIEKDYAEVYDQREKAIMALTKATDEIKTLTQKEVERKGDLAFELSGAFAPETMRISPQIGLSLSAFNLGGLGFRLGAFVQKNGL